MTLYYVISAVLTLVLTALNLRHLIPVLKSKKMGQKILDIGPRWHKSKEGTPTMGGLSFIAAFFVTIIPVIAFACANMGETLNIVLEGQKRRASRVAEIPASACALLRISLLYEMERCDHNRNVPAVHT